MTCRCLEALHRELDVMEPAQSEGGYPLMLSVWMLRKALRSALASKDAGPLADHDRTAPSQEGAGSAGGLATRVHVVSPGHNWGSQMWSVVKDDGGLFCLTFYADRADGGRARATAELIARAVNALPQDAGEPK